jgi:hypothetical protein
MTSTPSTPPPRPDTKNAGPGRAGAYGSAMRPMKLLFAGLVLPLLLMTGCGDGAPSNPKAKTTPKTAAKHDVSVLFSQSAASGTIKPAGKARAW